MFLEIHTDRRRKNAYSYGLFRETFRENGRVRHRTRGRVTGLRHEQLLTLRDFIRSGCPGSGQASCEVSDSREWGGQSRRVAAGRWSGGKTSSRCRRTHSLPSPEPWGSGFCGTPCR